MKSFQIIYLIIIVFIISVIAYVICSKKIKSVKEDFSFNVNDYHVAKYYDIVNNIEIAMAEMKFDDFFDIGPSWDGGRYDSRTPPLNISQKEQIMKHYIIYIKEILETQDNITILNKIKSTAAAYTNINLLNTLDNFDVSNLFTNLTKSRSDFVKVTFPFKGAWSTRTATMRCSKKTTHLAGELLGKYFSILSNYICYPNMSASSLDARKSRKLLNFWEEIETMSEYRVIKQINEQINFTKKLNFRKNFPAIFHWHLYDVQGGDRLWIKKNSEVMNFVRAAQRDTYKYFYYGDQDKNYQSTMNDYIRDGYTNQQKTFQNFKNFDNIIQHKLFRESNIITAEKYEFVLINNAMRYINRWTNKWEGNTLKKVPLISFADYWNPTGMGFSLYHTIPPSWTQYTIPTDQYSKLHPFHKFLKNKINWNPPDWLQKYSKDMLDWIYLSQLRIKYTFCEMLNEISLYKKALGIMPANLKNVLPDPKKSIYIVYKEQLYITKINPIDNILFNKDIIKKQTMTNKLSLQDLLSPQNQGFIVFCFNYDDIVKKWLS